MPTRATPPTRKTREADAADAGDAADGGDTGEAGSPVVVVTAAARADPRDGRERDLDVYWNVQTSQGLEIRSTKAGFLGGLVYPSGAAPGPLGIDSTYVYIASQYQGNQVIWTCALAGCTTPSMIYSASDSAAITTLSLNPTDKGSLAWGVANEALDWCTYSTKGSCTSSAQFVEPSSKYPRHRRRGRRTIACTLQIPRRWPTARATAATAPECPTPTWSRRWRWRRSATASTLDQPDVDGVVGGRVLVGMAGRERGDRGDDGGARRLVDRGRCEQRVLGGRQRLGAEPDRPWARARRSPRDRTRSSSRRARRTNRS